MAPPNGTAAPPWLVSTGLGLLLVRSQKSWRVWRAAPSSADESIHCLWTDSSTPIVSLVICWRVRYPPGQECYAATCDSGSSRPEQSGSRPRGNDSCVTCMDQEKCRGFRQVARGEIMSPARRQSQFCPWTARVLTTPAGLPKGLAARADLVCDQFPPLRGSAEEDLGAWPGFDPV